MTSIKDIARICGVSPGTVSKALNNQKDVSEKTRRLIRQKAKELGYRANITAQSLRTNRTRNIGVIFHIRDNKTISHEYYNLVIGGFRREAEKNGYDITFLNTTNTDYSYLDHASYRSFDGIVVIAADLSTDNAKELLASDLPIVLTHNIALNHSCIISDDYHGTASLVKLAYEKGHRKIAYITGEESEVTYLRLDSYLRALDELGISKNTDYIIRSAFRDIKKSYEALEQLISLPDPPTCILFSDDYTLLGVIGSLKNNHITRFDHLSFAGYDGISLAKMLALTTYEQDGEEIGRTAAKKLIEEITNPSAEHSIITVPGILLEGDTIKEL